MVTIIRHQAWPAISHMAVHCSCVGPVGFPNNDVTQARGC